MRMGGIGIEPCAAGKRELMNIMKRHPILAPVSKHANLVLRGCSYLCFHLLGSIARWAYLDTIKSQLCPYREWCLP